MHEPLEALALRLLNATELLRTRFPAQEARHVKTSKTYQILTIALKESTLEPVVVYQRDGVIWSRSLEEFCEKFD